MSAHCFLKGLQKLLHPAVLLPVPSGTKGCRIPGWARKTLADMADPAYLALFVKGCNIGVLLGDASEGLCSIDFDDDAAADEFLTLNPRLAATLRSRGARGCNIWIRFMGAFPASRGLKHKIKLNAEGKAAAVGEWRANGNSTIISGIHPNGVNYAIVVVAKPMMIGFAEIAWPPDWTNPGETQRVKSAAQAASAAAGDPPPGKNEILILPSGPVTITQCADELFPRIGASKKLFSRGLRVVEVIAGDNHDRRLELVSAQAFRSRMEEFASFFAWRTGEDGRPVLKPKTPSADMAAALLETVAAREGLPRIVGLANCPVLRQEGDTCRIISGGYDDESGIFVTGGAEPAEVAVEVAVAALKSLVEEVVFQSPGDRSRAIAALLAPALKFGGLLPGKVPLDVGEADDSQSGKGYRFKVVAAIYNEVPTLVTQKKGGVGSADESLDAALLSGRPFVMLDNWRGKFESSHLEAILTAPGSVSVRVPFKAGVPVDPEWFIVGMTSNGVETTRDLANRSSIVRIRKQPPGFQFRRFPEGDLYDHVRANQPYYLGCVFSVILEWIQAGKPRTEETRHAARPWCQILDWIVQNIFGEAPLMDGHEGAQTRVANPALTFARNIALAASQRGQLGIPVTASNLYDLALECDLGVPSLQKPDDKAGPKLVGAAMAKVFGAANEIEVEGIRISRGSQKVPREDGQGSYEMKIYTFTVNKHQPA